MGNHVNLTWTRYQWFHWTQPSGRRTFSEDLDDVVGVEAQLVGVLGVVGVQSFTLGGPRFGFRPTRSRNRLHLLGETPVEPAGQEYRHMSLMGATEQLPGGDL